MVKNYIDFYLKKTFYGKYVKNTFLPLESLKNNLGNQKGIKNTGQNKTKLRHNTIRTKTRLIQRAIHNFADKNVSFITLTYEKNMLDIKKAKQHINTFFKKINAYWYDPIREKWKKRYGIFKYMYVYEYQKRGAVHFHIICNTHQIKKQMIENFWKHGKIWAQDIKKISKTQSTFIIKYLSKYVSKVQNDKKSKNQYDLGVRAYAFSQTCSKPKIIKTQINTSIKDIVNSVEKSTHFYIFKGVNDNTNSTFILGMTVDSLRQHDRFKFYERYTTITSKLWRNKNKNNLYNFAKQKYKGYNDFKIIGNANNYKVYEQQKLFDSEWRLKGKKWDYIPKKH